MKETKKLVTCILLASFLALPSLVQAQNITLKGNQMTLKKAFNIIERQSGLSIDYDASTINTDKVVNVKEVSGTVDNCIRMVLMNTGYTHSVKGSHIIISNRNQTFTNQSTDGKKTNSRKITGKVTDSQGVPIIGATIREIDSKNGTVTDIDGNYSIHTNGNSRISISYIGYHAQIVNISDNKTTYNVILKEDQNNLNEVVVVGYGTMKKRDLTGSVTSIKMTDAPVGTVASISHALAGKAAGLQVNTISAQPGGGASFRVRGAASVNGGNDPLIIIDGFPVNSSGDISVGKYSSGTTDNILASINPNDIESIEVLKDASATGIYGARAGHGVIIITTKKGKSGNAKVTYSGTVSVQSMAKKYEMLNAREFMQITNDYLHEKWMRSNGVGIYGGKNEDDVSSPFIPRYSDSEIANPVNDTDWFGAITRSGFQTQHNVSVTGGTDHTKYMVSGNFFTQNGVVRNNDMTRYTGRVNLEQDINKYVKFGVNFTLSKINNNNVPLGYGQNENASIMVAASQFNPLLSIKDENGLYTLNSQAAFLPNPVSLLEITDKTTKERVLGTAYIEYRPIKELLLRTNFGLDRNAQRRETYLPKTTLYGAKKNGQANIGQYDKTDYLFEFTGNYIKTIDNHSFNVLMGYSFQRFTDKWLTAGNNDFITDAFEYNNLGAGAYPSPTVGSSAKQHEMASFFGRFNYTYKDRYLLTATLRADGASNFAKNHKWGYFPSLALGWRFTEENFMKTLGWLSNGKLRLSFGQTGNSNVGNKAISYYATGYDNEFGGTKHVGVYLAQQGNPDLKWETTTEWNAGLELGFFNNRISLTADYFHRVVSDLLNRQSLMSYHEVNSIMANVGKTQSRGLELTLHTENINSRDFDWNSTFTFSFYRDKWKERSPQWKPSAYSEYYSPIRYYAGYLSDGLVQPGEKVPYMKGVIPGQVKLKDINGYVYNEDGTYKVDKYGIPLKTGTPDGKLDDADKVIYGNADPGYLAGFNNTLRYKNFDLNIYFYGEFGVYTQGSYKDLWLTGFGGMTGIVNLNRGYNMPVSAKDVWTHGNTAATHPGYFQTDSSYGVGDYFLRKSWFIRCRNITVGYTMPINKKCISKMRFYVDANNLFYLTPYKGLDLETDNSVWAYPNVRTFTVGLDITF